jgi:hypothetical protein
MAQTRDNAFRYGGMANTGVAEGKQNAPVGTTLAMIEQATKIEGGVHKALHSAQMQEFLLLKELFKEDPDALWRGNKRPAMGKNPDQRRQRFLAALENCDIIPASDPNVPSNMHRIAKANALFQAASANPMVFNVREAAVLWCRMMKIDPTPALLPPPPPPGQPQPDPVILAGLALKNREVQVKEAQVALQADKAQKDRESKENIAAMQIAERAHASQQSGMPDPTQQQAMDLKARQLDQGDAKLAFDAHNSHAERESKEAIKAMDIASRLATHPESQPIVNAEMQNLSGIISPAANNSASPMSDGGAVEFEDDETADIRRRLAAVMRAIEQGQSGAYAN